ncbi:MAG TPA: SDR family NAD(P)-dependent oxidoreductase [Acidimicrobiales bacterium]|nr:SDR family NAD(P)-dependent oxidoreductase [Acidimicrobiales bacterium]
MGALTGRVAIVTGASRGIGEEIAVRLAAEGARVAASARTVEPGDSRFEGSLAETVARIEASGGEAMAVKADLSSNEDRERLVAETEAALGPIDILVNNAAVTFFIPVADFPPKRYDLMFEVQVRAAFHLAQLVLPGMRARRSGWILNISSAAARHPEVPPTFAFGGGTVYGMCKAALERFTSGLAAEVYADNVAVNCLSPAGVVATPGVMHHKLIPPGREDIAEPVELMAEAALALVSGDPATMTGKITYSKQLLEEINNHA